ncbi:MAG: carbon-nitrogen hydrolase family protein [Roseitalea sp.]|jgi:predicted amidohydrolase|nr:carbon-nitrogen hydrolase family protein [Roseitalea sp.]MBO6720830.1 carbon-nitrogen hydrolase family protein [Roseitalea sp.]MBO6743135.1 carbon-nitrogen hydrolase family protein [Roseitalea sp.]
MAEPKVRVASVQMALMETRLADALFARVAHFVRTASSYGAQFVCFPEHFTIQLLSGEVPMVPAAESVDRLAEHTPALRHVLGDLAKEHAITIIGGSHATRMDDGAARNVSFVAHPDGRLSEQHKLHPTPDERSVWGISGGSRIEAIETEHGAIGVTICYDSEFPELGRRLADQGARIIFVPYCTDTRHGHFRVRYCCHARTVENQCHVVTSGLVGNLPNTANLEMAYAQSAVLTPSDHGFARDGIAAEAEPQAEQMIIADLDMAALDAAREGGSVRNLADRRLDLYSVAWR